MSSWGRCFFYNLTDIVLIHGEKLNLFIDKPAETFSFFFFPPFFQMNGLSTARAALLKILSGLLLYCFGHLFKQTDWCETEIWDWENNEWRAVDGRVMRVHVNFSSLPWHIYYFTVYFVFVIDRRSQCTKRRRTVFFLCLSTQQKALCYRVMGVRAPGSTTDAFVGRSVTLTLTF